jgi:hypothetical protein
MIKLERGDYHVEIEYPKLVWIEGRLIGGHFGDGYIVRVWRDVPEAPGPATWARYSGVGPVNEVYPYQCCLRGELKKPGLLFNRSVPSVERQLSDAVVRAIVLAERAADEAQKRRVADEALADLIRKEMVSGPHVASL